MVPIYLEISEGISMESLVEMGVPAATEHQIQVKLLKFQVVSKRIVLFKRDEKEGQYKSMRFCAKSSFDPLELQLAKSLIVIALLQISFAIIM